MIDFPLLLTYNKEKLSTGKGFSLQRLLLIKTKVIVVQNECTKTGSHYFEMDR